MAVSTTIRILQMIASVTVALLPASGGVWASIML
jgi:hypothetical protein